MTFKYETHCHTSNVSLCSRLQAKDIVELYIANGYNGVFITDHFLNCPSFVEYANEKNSYKEKIDIFCSGYEQVKDLAKNKLQVFFGLEYSYKGTDLLVYGWDKKRLTELEKIINMKMSEFVKFARENGALVVQAHPFRQAHYIDHIRLFPETEGVEIFNACRTEKENELAKFYAQINGKITTGGSDIHRKEQEILSGIEFDEKIENEKHFISLMRSGKGKIIKIKNNLKF